MQYSFVINDFSSLSPTGMINSDLLLKQSQYK